MRTRTRARTYGTITVDTTPERINLLYAYYRARNYNNMQELANDLGWSLTSVRNALVGACHGPLTRTIEQATGIPAERLQYPEFKEVWTLTIDSTGLVTAIDPEMP